LKITNPNLFHARPQGASLSGISGNRTAGILEEKYFHTDHRYNPNHNSTALAAKAVAMDINTVGHTACRLVWVQTPQVCHSGGRGSVLCWTNGITVQSVARRSSNCGDQGLLRQYNFSSPLHMRTCILAVSQLRRLSAPSFKSAICSASVSVMDFAIQFSSFLPVCF